eukprot:CAMPEP_0198733234 /NCGR_PEP_ID=MMETSP1475-20131203/43862_1 /TAXON_ID= ORGANISM="Unidentified sp., Strain CCMP1999" /NCGR_SAMPLE_ID=MMETSP1475 /ASSEMBLY_ACC=CAM_ASM_001111 /LENGTH=119 /DNA_ID=CAMNT_0044496495 /DNA_START=137 /DNA_END=492 /DNA_ORIENTATION=+
MEERTTPADQMRVGSARKPGKVPLKPGRSQLDWLRTKKSIRLGPQRGVSTEELSKHKTKDDAWTAIRGRVYNISPYVEYHPGGGAQLMRAAGRDGTALFDEYHAWVNIDFMLDSCVVGT